MSRRNSKSGSAVGPSGGTRDLKVRVRTAKKRKTSSTRWLQRQLNDPYVAEAKRQGYRSRAAFKLSEMNDRYNFLKPGMKVLDLGCAPGGWTQIAVRCVSEGNKRGRVLGVDLLPVDPIEGATIFLLDFLSEEAPGKILEFFAGSKVDVVLSDMAAPASGHRKTDHLKIMALCETALEFAHEILEPGGTFCAKVLRGGTENDMLRQMKRSFESVRHIKPNASRSDSTESYVLAMGYRPNEKVEEA